LVLAPYQKPVGRPPTITLALTARIIGEVRGGLGLRSAAWRSGVSQQCAQRWKTKGEQLWANEELDPSRLTEAECLYILLARGIGEAEAELERELVDNLRRDGQGDWRAWAWWLERRWPEVYGRKAELRVDLFRLPPPEPTEQLDEPTTAERMHALDEAGQQLGVTVPGERSAERPSNRDDCAQLGHRPGAGMRCVGCGKDLAGDRPAIEARRPTGSCVHVASENDRQTCANCGVYFSQPLPVSRPSD
jgi:hypothetical protein